MLQKIHDKITGWVAGIVIGLIGITFIFWGVETGFGQVSYAAKVKGHEQPFWSLSAKIPLQDVNRVYQNQLTMYQQQLRGEVPQELRTRLQNDLVESFVRRQLIEQHADQLGYRVRDEDIRRAIEQEEMFQLDGKYNDEVAKRVLANQGFTTASFREDVRRRLQIAQVQAAISASSFATPAEIERAQALQNQEREVSWAVIDPASLEAAITPDEKAIADYYAKNPQRFMTPETVTLKYVELEVANMGADVVVNDDVLRAEYEQQKERFVEPERRHARHILVNVGQGADEAAARKKADDLLAKAKAPGADFAALARQHSEDAGSAQQGGDLGWLERSFFTGPLSDAVFSMQSNEIRGPVRSEFGYHIVRLEGIEAGKQKTFEQAREELATEYRTAQAEKQFTERQETLAVSAFENIDNLDAAAKDVEATVQTVPGFQRNAGGGPFASNPEIIAAAFSERVLGGENSEPIELEPGHVVVLRSEDHKKSAQRPLAEVREEIVRAVKREGAEALAKSRGEAALAKLKAGTPWKAVVDELKIATQGPKFVTRTDPDLPEGLRQAVFSSTKPAQAPVYDGVAMPSGYGLFALSSVRVGATAQTPDQRQMLVRQVEGGIAQGEVMGYIEELRRQAEIDINPRAFE